MFFYESDVEMTQNRKDRVIWSLNNIIWLKAPSTIKCSGFEILAAHASQLLQLAPLRYHQPMQFLMAIIYRVP